MHVDQREVGDIVLASTVGHIAFRVRRPDCKYRDLTLRSRRASGVETEIHKIRKGFGRWYLYAWTIDLSNKFSEWILVDLDKFRGCGLADSNRREWPNQDGGRTFFFAYKISELLAGGCLVSGSTKKPTANKPKAPRSVWYDQELLLEAVQHDQFHREYCDD